MKIIKLILVSFTICSVCLNCKNEQKKEIKVIQNQTLDVDDFRDISLEIYFDYGFQNDTVKVYSNDTLIFDKVLTTDDQDGTAGFIEFKNKPKQISIFSKKDSAKIQINNLRLIIVTLSDSLLSIQKFKKIPENLIYD